MPAKRVYVPLSPELDSALEVFNAETGIAKSQLLSQLLAETVPVIQAMTDAFRIAKKSPPQAAAAMRDLVSGAHVKLAQLQLDMQPKPARKRMRKSPRR